MKKLFTSLVLTFAVALSLRAQGLSPVFNTQDQLAFNTAYRASLAPGIVAYMALPYNAFDAGSGTASTRTTPTILLATASKYQLDTQIMVWGWDPYTTMLVRIVQGYAWVPSFGQANIPIGPGLSMPTVPYVYNPAAPPRGAILMPLVNASGKMALPAPFPVPIVVGPAVADPVGFLEMPFGAAGGIGDWYSIVTGDTSPLLTVFTNSRGTFKKQPEGQDNLADPGVRYVFWVKVK